MKTAPLSVDLLRIDAGTQSRLCISEDAVEDYSEIISSAPVTEWPFPPLDVFHDGNEYFVADGFHRCLGAKQAGRGSIPCVIHKGTAADARIFAMTANDRHGMRMSRADKRSNVEWLLDNCVKMPQKEIAQKAGVSARLVQMIVADRKPKLVPQQPPPVATKAQIANLQPVEGEFDPFGDFDPSDWPEADDEKPQRNATGKSKNGSKTVKQKTPEQSEAWQAQQVLKTWMDALGRWMNGNPHGIDTYRERFPGPKGDKVIEAAKALFCAIEAWKKVIK